MPCTSTYQGVVSVTAPHRTEPEPTGAPHRKMMSVEAEPEPTEAAQRKAMTRETEPEPIELPHREVMTAEPVPTEAEPSILQGSDDTVILPEEKLDMTDSQFDRLLFCSVQATMVSETDNIWNITLPQLGIAHAPSISGQADVPHAQKNDVVQPLLSDCHLMIC